MIKYCLNFLFFCLCTNNAWAEKFPGHEFLKDAIDFYVDIFSKYESNQVVFYDAKSYFIYDILDLPVVPNEISSPKYMNQVLAHKENVKSALKDILEKKKNLSALAKKIKRSLKKEKITLSNDQLDNLRFQNALKSQFELGLKTSGKYEKEITTLLENYNLPKDLMAIIFVESLFYENAVSSKGASGPWGLMKETAMMHGITVNSLVDERLDFLISTIAAINFLKKAKEGLKEWPFAITAYNYGYAGMLRARANFPEGDFEKIIKEHESPIFGFASKNYYPTVKAVMKILADESKYFPNLKKENSFEYDLVEFLRPVKIADLEKYGVIDKALLKKLNPALAPVIVSQNASLPANFSVRIPKGQKNKFIDKLKKVPHESRISAGNLVLSSYHAKGNETVIGIAKKNGLLAEFLAKRLNSNIYHKPKGKIYLRNMAHTFTNLIKAVENLSKKVALD